MTNVERGINNSSIIVSTVQPEGFVLTAIESNRTKDAGEARRHLEEAYLKSMVISGAKILAAIVTGEYIGDGLVNSLHAGDYLGAAVYAVSLVAVPGTIAVSTVVEFAKGKRSFKKQMKEAKSQMPDKNSWLRE
jgi:hypothetical protein